MLLIWSGWGILVVPTVAGTAFVVSLAIHALLTSLGHPDLTFLGVSAGLLAAAAANWFVGRRLNGTPPRELVDPHTQQRFMFQRLHKLFWIRMEYWSIPVLILAFVPLLALGPLFRP